MHARIITQINRYIFIALVTPIRREQNVLQRSQSLSDMALPDRLVVYVSAQFFILSSSKMSVFDTLHCLDQILILLPEDSPLAAQACSMGCSESSRETF